MNQSDLICNKCDHKGALILSTVCLDYSCEVCGEWQDFILNDIYYPINYKEKVKQMATTIHLGGIESECEKCREIAGENNE